MTKLGPIHTRRLTSSRATYHPLAVDPRPLRPNVLNATRSDEFDQGALDGAWSTQGTPASALALAGNSWATVAFNGTNQYVYRAAPSGDFTVSAAMQWPITASGHMQGLMVVDGGGNGVGLCPYASPDEWILTTVAAGVYNSSFVQVGTALGTTALNGGGLQHYRIIKSGTSYTAQIGSADGTSWSSVSASQTGPATATRIGVGRWFGTNSYACRIDWIDVT